MSDEVEVTTIRMRPVWHLHKFKDPTGEVAHAMNKKGISIDEAREAFADRFMSSEIIPGNVALNQGLQNAIKLICAISSGTAWNSANSRCGVGNGTAAASAAQTGLLGSHVYAGMDTGYPTRTSQTAKWRSTFSGTVANFAWYEYTVSTTATNTGVNLNRKVSTKGTKSAGESWTLELQVTFS